MMSSCLLLHLLLLQLYAILSTQTVPLTITISPSIQLLPEIGPVGFQLSLRTTGNHLGLFRIPSLGISPIAAIDQMSMR